MRAVCISHALSLCGFSEMSLIWAFVSLQLLQFSFLAMEYR